MKIYVYVRARVCIYESIFFNTIDGLISVYTAFRKEAFKSTDLKIGVNDNISLTFVFGGCCSCPSHRIKQGTVHGTVARSSVLTALVSRAKLVIVRRRYGGRLTDYAGT